MKLDTPKNFNNIFHINKLHLTNTDFFPNQPRNNTQPPLIQENRKKGFIIKNIMAEMKNKKGRGWKKQYKIK